MEAMLFQVAERSLRFCRLFETKNVNGKIRFFRVRPGRILTIARIVKGRRQAKFNVLFSSSLHSRVHQCPLRMLRASVVRACPSRIFSSAKIVKAEKKTGACHSFPRRILFSAKISVLFAPRAFRPAKTVILVRSSVICVRERSAGPELRMRNL